MPIPTISPAMAITAVSVTAGLLAIAEKAFKVSTSVRTALSRRTLKARLNEQAFAAWEIEKRTPKYYIVPDIQSADAAATDEPRRAIGIRESAFSFLDRVLMEPWQYRFLIVLADAAMGKTSLLLNYASYHWRSRKRSKRFSLYVFPLGSSLTDEMIKAIPLNQRKDTVLFLDALDEDKRAIDNHTQRLEDLLALTMGFRAVLITARTHFFGREEDIPDRTEIVVSGPTGPGESKELRFHRTYLAPFSDRQVEMFLTRRFPVWRKAKRAKSRAVIGRTPEIAVRPMVLSHIEDLIDKNVELNHRSQIYETIVEAWLAREAPIVPDPRALRRFSSELAIRLMRSKLEGGPDRLPIGDLVALVDPEAFNLKTWQVTGRSLVNRDVVNNFKFVHRSIMEYLYAVGIMDAKVVTRSALWTDEVTRFVSELILLRGAVPFDFQGAILDSAVVPLAFARMDLASVDLTGLKDLAHGRELWKQPVNAVGVFVESQVLEELAREIALELYAWAYDNRRPTYRWMDSAFQSLWLGLVASFDTGEVQPRFERVIRNERSHFDLKAPAEQSDSIKTILKLTQGRQRLGPVTVDSRNVLLPASFMCGAIAAVADSGDVRKNRNRSHFYEDVGRAIFKRYDATPGLIYEDAAAVQRMTLAARGPSYVVSAN